MYLCAMSKKTLVLGATTNPDRTAYTAVHKLLSKGHEVIPVGVKEGEVAGLPIRHGQPMVDGIDTVTMYVGPRNQPVFYDYILQLKPRRVVFNPGSENQELEQLLIKNGIEPVEACTLVLLSIGKY